MSVLILGRVLEEGCSWKGWVVQDHSLPQRGISVTVVRSYVKVTFSNFSATEHGSSVIRGESAEAIHLYISNPQHLAWSTVDT